MADNILYAQNKLRLINKCLEAIGEMPLELDTSIEDIIIGTDAYVAISSIDDATLEVLTEGWSFNVDRKYKLVPDLNNKIGIPENVLNIDGGSYNERGDLVIKNSQLYSRKNQSFEFKNEVYVDITWFVDYADMPSSVFNYIGAKSANRFQYKIITDTTLYKMLAQEENEWRMRVEKEDFQNQDFNLVDDYR